jgi:uncharacterized ion transporter superfamily protein YfcC
MNIQLITEIVVIVLLFIVFTLWVAWQIKKKGLKEFVTDMIIRAEDMFEKGKNDEKFDYVVEKVIAFLPKPFNLFITTSMVENLVQNVFDGLKKALDYTPKIDKGDE